MAKLIHTIGAAKKVLISKKMGTKYWSERFNLFIFAVNVVDVWLAYQVITRTAEMQSYFYNYMAEEMIDNTYNIFIIRHSEGRKRTIVDSDDNYVNDKNPLFGHINGAPSFVINLHFTPTKKRSKNRDVTETQYLIQCVCKVCQKKTTHVCSECADTYAVRN